MTAWQLERNTYGRLVLIDEAGEHGVGQSQGKLPHGHHDGAENDGATLTEEGIGQPATDERCDVDQTCIDAIQLEGIGLRPAQATGSSLGSQIEHQQGAHAVVGKSFP